MSLDPNDPATVTLRAWADEVEQQLAAGTSVRNLELPTGVLGEFRATVLEALDLAMRAGGWPGRVHPTPPATINTPVLFGDVITVSTQGDGLVATLPVVLAVDGADSVQIAALDRLMLLVWSALEATRTTNGQVLDVLTAGPTDIDLGGASTVGIVFTVQQGLRPRTLTPQPLVSDSPPEGTTP